MLLGKRTGFNGSVVRVEISWVELRCGGGGGSGGGGLDVFMCSRRPTPDLETSRRRDFGGAI